MKIAPVSGDLLVKLALVAGAVGLLVYGVRKASAALASPFGTVTDVLYGTADAIGNAWQSGAINPASTENVIYSGLNGALFPAGNDNIGGWLYDLFHADPMAPPSSYTNALNAWGTAGRWNNPSAYTAPTNQGGAAFGIYPRP
jgi:hypothetical protein